MEKYLIPAAAGILGFLAQNIWKILGFRRQKQTEDLDIGERLMKAVKDAHTDLVGVYELLNVLEKENYELKMENTALKTKIEEKDRLIEQKDEIIQQIRTKLADVEFKLEQAEQAMQQYFHLQPFVPPEERPNN